MNQHSLSKHAHRLLLSSHAPGIGVDIDDTLCLTATQWMARLQQMFGNPERLSVNEMRARYRYAQHVPYWQTPEALAWMETWRNSHQAQMELMPVEGSSVMLREINARVPVVAYITARPQAVHRVTEEWLRIHDFPQTAVISRPSTVLLEEAARWKASVLVRYYPQISGYIDDSADILKYLPSDYQGRLFLYGQTHCPPSTVEVIACGSWRQLRDQICAWRPAL